MKKYLLLLCLLVSAMASCTSGNKTNVKQDSLEAAAAADSMLKEALSADTLRRDTVKAADTLNVDSL